ncbi:MAG: hypothetical protein AB1540_05765 [Bdellovibrionota bacterium]
MASPRTLAPLTCELYLLGYDALIRHGIAPPKELQFQFEARLPNSKDSSTAIFELPAKITTLQETIHKNPTDFHAHRDLLFYMARYLNLTGVAATAVIKTLPLKPFDPPSKRQYLAYVEEALATIATRSRNELDTITPYVDFQVHIEPFQPESAEVKPRPWITELATTLSAQSRPTLLIWDTRQMNPAFSSSLRTSTRNREPAIFLLRSDFHHLQLAPSGNVFHEVGHYQQYWGRQEQVPGVWPHVEIKSPRDDVFKEPDLNRLYARYHLIEEGLMYFKEFQRLEKAAALIKEHAIAQRSSTLEDLARHFFGIADTQRLRAIEFADLALKQIESSIDGLEYGRGFMVSTPFADSPAGKPIVLITSPTQESIGVEITHSDVKGHLLDRKALGQRLESIRDTYILPLRRALSR